MCMTIERINIFMFLSRSWQTNSSSRRSEVCHLVRIVTLVGSTIHRWICDDITMLIQKRRSHRSIMCSVGKCWDDNYMSEVYLWGVKYENHQFLTNTLSHLGFARWEVLWMSCNEPSVLFCVVHQVLYFIDTSKFYEIKL